MLPLLKRELAVASRRPLTFRMRSGFGGGVMALSVWAVLVWGGSRSFSGGLFFYLLFGATALAMLGTGVFVAADAISLERREGTLPLLFLTDLTTPEVVLGKLIAVSLLPIVTLLSVFPSLAIWQLMGGLSIGDLVRATLVLIVILFSSTTATLLVSSLLRERWQVVLGSIALLTLFNPLWLVAGLALLKWPGFLLSLAGFVLLGLIFLIATDVALERNWRSDLSAKEQTPDDRATKGPLMSDPNLITHLLIRTTSSRRIHFVRWGLGATVSAIVVACISRGYVVAALNTLFAVHLACILGMTARTTATFARKRDEGEFEILLSTPLKDEDIFVGFSRFLTLHSRPFFLFLTGLDVLSSALLLRNPVPQLLVFPLAMAAVLWITLAGVSWLGVYRAFMQNSPILSAFWTFWRLSLFPILLSALFLWAPRTDYRKVCFFWVFSSGFLALFFSSDARRVLFERGRELLLRPACDRPPQIESEWSFIDWEGLKDENETARAQLTETIQTESPVC